jgi:hypothetical protein
LGKQLLQVFFRWLRMIFEELKEEREQLGLHACICENKVNYESLRACRDRVQSVFTWHCDTRPRRRGAGACRLDRGLQINGLRNSGTLVNRLSFLA